MALSVSGRRRLSPWIPGRIPLPGAGRPWISFRGFEFLHMGEVYFPREPCFPRGWSRNWTLPLRRTPPLRDTGGEAAFHDCLDSLDGPKGTYCAVVLFHREGRCRCGNRRERRARPDPIPPGAPECPLRPRSFSGPWRRKVLPNISWLPCPQVNRKTRNSLSRSGVESAQDLQAAHQAGNVHIQRHDTSLLSEHVKNISYYRTEKRRNKGQIGSVEKHPAPSWGRMRQRGGTRLSALRHRAPERPPGSAVAKERPNMMVTAMAEKRTSK